MISDKQPNFLIAGAQKSGTSSLYRMLKVHPDIFMSEQKELNFFNQPQITDKGFLTYLENFSAASKEQYRGEATPHYFSSESPERSLTATRIRRFLGPEVRILVILRNPVERAIAGWRHNVVYGRIDEGTSVFDMPQPLMGIQLSRYKQHWSAWTNVFPDEQIHICLFDDLAKQPQNMLQDILAWLDLPVDEVAYAGYPFDRAFNDITSTMQAHDVLKLPVVSETTVNELISHFVSDIQFVRHATGKALEDWDDVQRILSKFKVAMT